MGAAHAGLTLHLASLYAAVVAAVFLNEAFKRYLVMGALVSCARLTFAERLPDQRN